MNSIFLFSFLVLFCLIPPSSFFSGPLCFLLYVKSPRRERDRNARCASKQSSRGCKPRWCRRCLPSTFRLRFFYNPARRQWRQHLPNDPSFLWRGFSGFFFFLFFPLPRGTKNHEERRLMTGKTPHAISIMHFAHAFFFLAWVIFYYYYYFCKLNNLLPKDAASARTSSTKSCKKWP